MPRKSPPRPDEKPQFERFLEAVKQVEAANTDRGLKSVVRHVARSVKSSPKAASKDGT